MKLIKFGQKINTTNTNIKYWVTSDLHFWHKGVLGFCPNTRPWSDVESMNEGLIEHWNTKVGVNDEVLCKLKSPYYLGKKAFLRMGRKRIDLAWDNPNEFKKQIDEEFYSFHQYLLDGYTKEVYHTFSENERRQLIERYFNEK